MVVVVRQGGVEGGVVEGSVLVLGGGVFVRRGVFGGVVGMGMGVEEGGHTLFFCYVRRWEQRENISHGKLFAGVRRMLERDGSSRYWKVQAKCVY
jgi:hypothetical protein